jgi:hypothetical protein
MHVATTYLMRQTFHKSQNYSVIIWSSKKCLSTSLQLCSNVQDPHHQLHHHSIAARIRTSDWHLHGLSFPLVTIRQYNICSACNFRGMLSKMLTHNVVFQGNRKKFVLTNHPKQALRVDRGWHRGLKPSCCLVSPWGSHCILESQVLGCPKTMMAEAVCSSFVLPSSKVEGLPPWLLESQLHGKTKVCNRKNGSKSPPQTNRRWRKAHATTPHRL